MRATTLSLLAATAAAAPTELVQDTTDAANTTSGSNPCANGCTNIPSKAYSNIQKLPIPQISELIWPWQTFKSSAFMPPAMNMAGPGTGLDDSYLFLGPYGFEPGIGVIQSAALIMDNEGELVYAINVTESCNFHPQMYNGKPHLTYWYGENTGWGYGNVKFLDEELNEFTFAPTEPEITSTLPKPPGIVDLHEQQMTPDGQNMLVTLYNSTPADLSSFGINDGWVVDSIVAEYDVKTGKPSFMWNARDHGVGFHQSICPIGALNAGSGVAGSPWEWIHINSAEKIGDNYLINSRHLWTTWLVSGKDGSIIWELNGKDGGDFAPQPNGINWSWQHHVRMVNSSSADGTSGTFTLSMFDNHYDSVLDIDVGPADALVIELTLPPSKKSVPKILRNITTSTPIESGSQGSFQPTLNNGNAFVGYGNAPVMAEFSPKLVNGTSQGLLREWTFGLPSVAESYRMFKMPWTSTPANWDPALVVEAGNGTSNGTTAYVSWNGATEVKNWDVYAGASQSALKFVGRAKKMGFETTFGVSGDCVQVAAVQGGKEVRKSNVACVKS